MSPLRARGSRAPAAWAVLWLTVLVSLAIALPAVGAAAAPVTWLARVGTAGANGQAAIVAPDAAGTVGSLKLSLKGLTARTTYPVKVQAGTCASPGAALFTAPSQKSSSAGKISKVVTIPATKMNAIRVATSLILRVGSGSKLRCGPFTGGPAPTPSPTPTPEIGMAVDLGSGLASIASDEASVWVVAAGRPIASRLDPTTGAVMSEVDFGQALKFWRMAKLTFNGESALGFGSLWVEAYDLTTEIAPSVYTGAGLLLRLDTVSLGSVVRIEGQSDLDSVAVGAGGVWTLQSLPNQLVRVDPATNAIAASIGLPEMADHVAIGGGSAWAIAKTKLLRVDLASKGVTSLDLAAETAGVAFVDGAAWVAVEGTDTAAAKLIRVSPETFTVVTSIDLPGPPAAVAGGGGYVWVAPAKGETPTAVGVATATNAIVATVTLPAALGSVTVRGRGAWFAGTGAGTVADLVRVDY